MYVYKTTSKFTSARKYTLIKLLTFIFAQRYSPSKKQPINLTQFWKLSNFKPIKRKKINVTLILSIIAKEKTDQIEKSEKKKYLASYNFDCFCYSLCYFNDLNNFFNGLRVLISNIFI